MKYPQAAHHFVTVDEVVSLVEQGICVDHLIDRIDGFQVIDTNTLIDNEESFD